MAKRSSSEMFSNSPASIRCWHCVYLSSRTVTVIGTLHPMITYICYYIKYICN